MENEITINGETYVKKTHTRTDMGDRPYVITRGKDHGVHAGYYDGEDTDGWITLLHARRIWYWDGAASLSEIAVYGCAEDRREKCRFAACEPMKKLDRKDTCEILYCQPEGQAMIEGQPEWRA